MHDGLVVQDRVLLQQPPRRRLQVLLASVQPVQRPRSRDPLKLGPHLLLPPEHDQVELGGVRCTVAGLRHGPHKLRLPLGEDVEEPELLGRPRDEVRGRDVVSERAAVGFVGWRVRGDQDDAEPLLETGLLRWADGVENCLRAQPKSTCNTEVSVHTACSGPKLHAVQKKTQDVETGQIFTTKCC